MRKKNAPPISSGLKLFSFKNYFNIAQNQYGGVTYFTRELYPINVYVIKKCGFHKLIFFLRIRGLVFDFCGQSTLKLEKKNNSLTSMPEQFPGSFKENPLNLSVFDD